MYNLEDYAGDQNVLVYGQNGFESGSDASLRILVQTHGSGSPVEGAWVGVTLRDENSKETLLFQGKTDEHGSPNAEFVIPEGLEGNYELLITAKSESGKDEIVKPVNIERTYRILLTSDKPLYQPGQTMHLRALSLRNSDLRPAQEEVVFEVEDSKGNKVFRKSIQSSEYGVAGTNFTLANEINYGRYTIRASVGEHSAEKKVEVKKYVLPKYRVSFDTDRNYYLPGQNLSGTVTSEYFFGKPASGAEVEVKIYAYGAEFRQIGNVKGIADSSGAYGFSFDLPSHFVGLPLEKGSALVFFNVSVKDKAGHEETITSSVPVSEYPVKIELVPENGELQKGIEKRYLRNNHLS